MCNGVLTWRGCWDLHSARYPRNRTSHDLHISLRYILHFLCFFTFSLLVVFNFMSQQYYYCTCFIGKGFLWFHTLSDLCGIFIDCYIGLAHSRIQWCNNLNYHCWACFAWLWYMLCSSSLCNLQFCCASLIVVHIL